MIKLVYLLLISVFSIVAKPCEGGKCTGSKYCSACKNCKYCKHCNSGGICGVCSPNSFVEKPKAIVPVLNKLKKSTSRILHFLFMQFLSFL